MNNAKRGKVVSYNKWGYIFLIPFVVVYAVFQLIPMVSTFYNSFFENYRSGLTQIGPNFVGLRISPRCSPTAICLCIQGIP